MAITFEIPTREIVVTTGQTNVTGQNLYNAIREFESSFQMMSYSKIMDSSGKALINAAEGVYTEIIITLVYGNEGGWTIRFEDENTAHCSVTGCTFLATDAAGDPRPVSTNYGLTINQSVSGTLIETGTSGLTATESTQLNGIYGQLHDLESIGGTDYDHSDLLRAIMAMVANVLAGAVAGSSGTATVKDMADSKTRITIDYDANGNRTSVTYNDLT